PRACDVGARVSCRLWRSAMDRHGIDWEGPFTAMITPFARDGAIDEAALRTHVDFRIAQGVRGLVPNGCTGEFWSQTLEERMRVAQIVLDAANKRVPVIVGTGASATRDVIALTEHCHRIGCDGVMIMAPYMVHPKKEDLYAHFKAVSDRVPIPIMLYNNPQDVGNDLPFDLVQRLCDLEWVVAIKDSTFDYNVFWKTQCELSERIRVFIGPSTMFGAPAVMMGADGWVDTYSNLWPELTTELYRVARDGDIKRARSLQKTGSELRSFLLHPEWNMYCAIKAAMNLSGLPGGVPRPPLQPLSAAHLDRMRQGLARFPMPVRGPGGASFENQRRRPT
ncbi:MAG TPA: 4-hydroxy-tetrahydrodipicolinate synthase, partial [Casimicrobiaceae bacterium]|nr:4-hydroxy-tetrahydrodipicolinate synthase [Casimicrobiaceae bacterium]